MQSSQNSPPDEPTFEQSLTSLERSLHELKERHAQVLRDQQQRSQLQQRQQDLKAVLRQGKSPELQVELRNIEQNLDALELDLESRLFSWSGLKEVFWQAVRFGGAGLVLGWCLAFWTIKAPTPPTPPPQSFTP
ncbi:hypothetical protein [Myxacorys almedinensis]|uniref:DUF2203 domain-containing protein n=1 Tax=Myxacorys almedinensis A TaxID=2690445 RepID=A0A8J8CM44_9CYAN|nr:hypothetical protein [Myxacorys almedinensis]NDJ18365.1 hypothetical protein [Myxacorys almedinensis A]